MPETTLLLTPLLLVPRSLHPVVVWVSLNVEDLGLTPYLSSDVSFNPEEEEEERRMRRCVCRMLNIPAFVHAVQFTFVSWYLRIKQRPEYPFLRGIICANGLLFVYVFHVVFLGGGGERGACMCTSHTRELPEAQARQDV